MTCQDTLPAKSEIFEYWKDRLGEIGFLIDWGEPSCWACGFHYRDKYDVCNPRAGWKRILTGWDRIPLQRCNIVPRSLQGSDGVDNLFLMCRECHDTAPNTLFPDIFFQWARKQSHCQRENDRLLVAMRWFDLTEADLPKVNEILLSEAFRSWTPNKFGLHRPQSNYPSVSSRLTPATMVGLVLMYMRTVEAQREP
jgi:hypothetical protein